jgi:hypothetical protein
MISLSYSKYSCWDKCPRKFKYRYIDKLEEPKNTAMSRGTEIHESVEAYLLGKTDQLHPDIHSYYGQFMFGLRNAGVIPELKVAVDPLWKVVDWEGDTYIRSVIDAHLPPDEAGTVKGFEWKTGKMYPDHADQRELYMVKLKCQYPEAKRIEMTGVYFDLKKNSPTGLIPDYYQELKIELWDNKMRKILRDEVFEPNPTFACRYCHFRRDNNGPCQF